MTVTKQACDCCRIRRVKCDGKGPCDRCLEHDLDCTYLQPLKKRGPKTIRARSFKKIADVQMTSMFNSPTAIAERPAKVPKKIIDQCLRLYHDHLYVIWPLLCYDDLHKLLEEKYGDKCVYWLLVALSAATLSDLQTEIEFEGVLFTGKTLTNLCMSSRSQYDNLAGTHNSGEVFKIIVYYCLQRCYGQLCDPRASYRLTCDTRALYRLTYEAVALIKILGLHLEETYKQFSFPEQQLRRKIYYLLLMADRYLSLYFHCATTLDSNIEPPQPEIVTDPRISLDSFLEMIRVFTIPGKCFFDTLATNSANESCTEESLQKIWKELHTTSLEIEPWSYGYADISFSRHWIRALAWKLVFQMKKTRINVLLDTNNTSIPVEIARDMLEDICVTPSNLYDVHGIGIPTKALEVASALVDVVSQDGHNDEPEALKFLGDISTFIFSLKHCDDVLIDTFTTKCQNALITLPITRHLEFNNDYKDDNNIVP